MSPLPNNIIYTRINWLRITKLLGIFVIFIGIVFLFSYILLKEVSIDEVKNYLNQEDSFLTSNIYTEKKSLNFIDTPNAPNAYTLYPLYIISPEAVIIKKINDINGFFNESNFFELSLLTTPKTFYLNKNNYIRVKAKIISRADNHFGIILASFNSQDLPIETDTDNLLDKNLELLDSKILFNENNLMNVRDEVKLQNSNFSLQIVSKNNKLIYKNNNPPIFLSKAAVYEEQSIKKDFKIINDNVTKEDFLVLSHTIFTNDNKPIVTIITARSLTEIYTKLKNFLIIVFPFLITIPMIIVIGYFIIRREILKLESKLIAENQDNFNRSASLNLEPINLIKTNEIQYAISFNKKDSVLKVNNESINIPYASNQYYLCRSLFSNKNKRWEQDELLEKMGEESTSSTRKIYDAALVINKKTKIKLIIYQDKTYRLNPKFEYI